MTRNVIRSKSICPGALVLVSFPAFFPLSLFSLEGRIPRNSSCSQSHKIPDSYQVKLECQSPKGKCRESKNARRWWGGWRRMCRIDPTPSDHRYNVHIHEIDLSKNPPTVKNSCNCSNWWKFCGGQSVFFSKFFLFFFFSHSLPPSLFHPGLSSI